MGESDAQMTAERMLSGLHLALLIIVSAILLGLDLPKVLSSYPRAAFFLVPVAVIVADTVLLARGRGWGRGLVVPLGVICAGYALFVFTAPPGPVLSLENWFFDVVGWLGVLVLFDRPLWAFGAFLLGYTLVTAAPAVLAGTATVDGLVSLAITVASVGGFQTAAIIATRALRWVASEAASAATAAEHVRTTEAVATRVHADGQRRYRELANTAGPLLRGLAEGTLDPTDPQVQRHCAIEAARMRRLFAENDDHPDRLLHELRAAIDVVERRGVEVHLIAHGSPATLPRDVRRALTDAPIRALSTAHGTARVVVAGNSTEVSVSVLAECDAEVASGIHGPGVRVTALADGPRQWIEATWQAN